MAAEIKEEYTSSLADLTMNSKPLINVLTILAEENIQHAGVIVEAIFTHLEKVRTEYKLPVLYLIDSIIKNVGDEYTNLFTQNIVSTFISVFKKVDEKTRYQMYKLRQTWNEVFPAKKLYALDVQVYHIDPAWPITASAPTTHTIHVNPKFLNKDKVSTSTTQVTTSNTVTTGKTTPVSNTVTTTTTTTPSLIKFEEKLNIKKQQLLELQKKKLELAMLQQTIQKMEEQSVHNRPTQQMLLKPGVMNTLVSNPSLKNAPVPKPLVDKTKPATTAASSLKVQSHPTAGHQVTATVANAHRPAVRDPRLLKQQAESNLSVETNVFHDNVNLVDRNKINNTINVDCVSTNNKTLNNKSSARSSTFTARDPRLVHSKTTSNDDGKPNDNRRSSPTKSNHASATTSSPRKGNSKNSRSKSTASSSSSENSKSNTINSSINSSSKKTYKDESSNGDDAARTSRSPSTSPSSKHKKRDFGDDKRSKSSKSDSKKRSGNKDSGDSTAGFKDLKGSTKNRNYMRRNRDVSVSPNRDEPTLDVDLRVGAPPDKQPRLEESTTAMANDLISKNTSLEPAKDVDLRQLPAPISKKRPSTEISDVNFAKKSRSEKLDILFGNEDVDLRTLNPVPAQNLDRLPTPPPPPIISSGPSDKSEDKKIKIVLKSQQDTVPTSKPDLDILRAKLANATKRSRLMEQKEQSKGEDIDLRMNGAKDDGKIIISIDDEQSIKTGNLSEAQYNALINKVVEHFEVKKLHEAQRRDSENLTNVSLQPISDDELSADFSHSDSDDDRSRGSSSKSHYKKRIITSAKPPVSSASSTSNSEPTTTTATRRKEPRKARWQPLSPAPRPGRRKWDSPPPQHPEPWIRPPMGVGHPYGPWRPVAPVPTTGPFIRPVMPDPYHNMGMTDANILTNVPATLPEYIRGDSPPPLGQFIIELPPANPVIINMVEKDTMKNIQIDKIPRDIRFYDDVAVCIMNWDDPRQILFQNGSAVITFNEKESYVLNFNEPYKDVLINGKPHKVKLGAPTREIYIDGNFYDCQFGGPGIGIEIDGNMTVVKLEGQTPQVKIGQSRKDLVAGKINLIIDARSMVPIFLDPKPQRFDIEGKVHTLRFVDALQTVLVNEVPFKVEFGGLPKPIQVYDRKHFIRFSMLPRGVTPGCVRIKNMQGYQPPASPAYQDEHSQDGMLTEPSEFDANTPALPMMGHKKIKQMEKDTLADRNSPNLGILTQGFPNLDVLSSVVGTNSVAPSSNYAGYSVENNNSNEAIPGLSESSPSVPVNTELVVPPPAPTASTGAGMPALPGNLDINDLFQKLVEVGIVTSKVTVPEPAPVVNPVIPILPIQQPLNAILPTQGILPVQPNVNVPPVLPTAQNISTQSKLFKIPKKLNISPVLFTQPETLKIRQSSLITCLYTGMQCSSCGMRFPPEQSMYYSQHLDWHFRQNRRGKNSMRKAMSRRWYYSLPDWKNYEEIEDLEEREKSYFENQQQQQLEAGTEEPEEEVEIPSVPADSDIEACCEVCRDKFEQFYNEEKEEWHLKMAIRVDGKTYHPLCYEDHKNALLEAVAAEAAKENEEIDDDEVKIIEKETEIITVLDTSERDVSNEGEENAEKTENSAEEKLPSEGEEDEEKQEETKEEEDMEKAEDATEDEPKEEDDDVIIHEVVPEKIDIANDDDDDYKEYTGGLIPGVVVKQEPIDDGFMDVDEVKMRSETIDADLHVEKVNTISVDTTLAGLVSSIDGNVQLDSGLPTTTGIGGKIKINITKQIAAPPPKETTVPSPESELVTELTVDPNEPLPPGEEPVQLNLKPALQGLTLKKMPLVKKGSELTGLCSIM